MISTSLSLILWRFPSSTIKKDVWMPSDVRSIAGLKKWALLQDGSRVSSGNRGTESSNCYSWTNSHSALKGTVLSSRKGTLGTVSCNQRKPLACCK